MILARVRLGAWVILKLATMNHERGVVMMELATVVVMVVTMAIATMTVMMIVVVVGEEGCLVTIR